jgi:predicted ATP-grasp superfamily ATP-dependent carboligase
VLTIEQQPRLHQGVLVASFSGWVDGGLAGGGSASLLAQGLASARTCARYDLAEYLDLQQTRPTVSLVDGETRRVHWPTIEVVAGVAGRDVLLVTGPEPSVRWKEVVDDLVQFAVAAGVTESVILGGMPAPVSHRRPLPVLATAASRSVAQEIGALRADYVGPTGIQTVLQVALGAAGVRSIGLWAQVPHYVAGTPSPPAIRALLDRLAELTRVTVDVSSLDAQIAEYTQQVESGLEERPDVAAMVAEIEAAQGPVEPPVTTEDLPSGDDLAAEIEQFLRDEG